MALASGCRNLERIHIGETEVTGAAVAALAKCCPKLKHITLLRGPDITETTIAALGISHIYINLYGPYQ